MTASFATELDRTEAESLLENDACIGSSSSIQRSSDEVHAAPESFERAYEGHVDMVWRGLRGLGVPESNVEDAVQDVFLVVHRRMSEFEGRSTFKTWLFGIVLRVARNHRRQSNRKDARESFEVVADVRDEGPQPDEEAATAQALRHLVHLLAGLDEAKREVFVLAELEQMSAPEIAETLGVNVNTIYSRLRAARRAFDAVVARTQGGRP